MKAKYSIVDDDTWNFNESGFMMGKISSRLVVTGSKKAGDRRNYNLAIASGLPSYRASLR
jgi:hypothetical protein